MLVRQELAIVSGVSVFRKNKRARVCILVC